MQWEGEMLGLVDFAAAAYITPFLPGGGRERTWGIIVGPPSSGKTELLRMFLDYNPEKEAPRRTILQDDLTENAFVSGYRSEENPDFDPSLLARLDFRRNPVGPKVLIVKEMGPILGLPRERRARFFHQMRKAFDGDYNAASGNLGTVYYKLGFGFLGAATEAVDDAKKQDQPLGERIMLCRMNRGGLEWEGRQGRIKSAVRGDPFEKEMNREVLRATLVRESEIIIRRLAETEHFHVAQPDALLDQLESLANITTIIRTVPISTQTHASAAEEGMRMALQLQTWADALATFDGRTEWNDADYSLMRRIALDTLPPDFLRAVVALWGGSTAEAKKFKGSEQVRTLSQSGESLSRQLQQWVLSGLLWTGNSGLYAMTDKALDLIVQSKLFDGLDPVKLLSYNRA